MGNIADEALAQQRLDTALKMRSARRPWTVIARECGYASPAAALSAVGEAMAAATMRAEMTADQMRAEASLTLDSLLSETLKMLDERAPETYDADGNPVAVDDRAVRLRAVDEARRLVEAQSKLHGLDKATEAPDDSGGIRIIGIADIGSII